MTWIPPEQYIKTIAHATIYGTVYFTDAAGNPLALRSTYGGPCHWQSPGGNMEKSDPTPLDTAVRECFDETGIRLVATELRLLLVHFLAPEAKWPDHSKVGFVYDGGKLTDEELAGIVLDATEHDLWEVHSFAGWETIMSPRDLSWFRACDVSRRTGRTQVLYEDYGNTTTREPV